MNIPSAIHRALSSLYGLIVRGIHFLYLRCIKPKGKTEDERRREFILNIILSSSIILILFLESILIVNSILHGDAYRGVSILVFGLLIVFFSFLFVLSRNGWYIVSSYLLIGAYMIGITYSLFMWSALLPPVFLSYVMIIVTTSVLIGTRAGFIMTGLVILLIVVISHLQSIGTLPVQLYWTNEPFTASAIIQDSLIILVITTISWLSNREIERSLARAHRSEAALIEERNNLEQKVEERTREVKKMQEEQFVQLQKFAEFGKLSSGMFHDLMSPLTAVIANVSQLEHSKENIPQVKEYLSKAVSASRRMGEYLNTVRKQLREADDRETFSLNKEVREAIDILQFHARENGVVLKLQEKKEVLLEGIALKLHQVALNLIKNAIDSYRETKHKRSIVTIIISTQKDHALLRVSDQGSGIPKDIQPTIFKPFFTTKPSSNGTGLGLSFVQDIVHSHKGTIEFESALGKGTTFSVLIPLRSS